MKQKQFEIKEKIKELRNMLMMLNLFISKQTEIFNEIVDERREKIIDLDKKKLIAII